MIVSMPAKTVRLSIDILPNEHKRIKALAAVMGVSIREFVTECLYERIYPEKKPNKETAKAIEDLEKRKNLSSAKNVEELFKDLGI